MDDREDPVLVLSAQVDDAVTLTWCAQLRSVLAAAPQGIVDCDVRRLTGHVEDIMAALLRLQLTALRCGGRIRLRRADPALLALVELCGLAEVLPSDEAAGDG